jgi:hypothetical protein
MSASHVRQKIGIIELALKDAGPEQALNAVIDALREIAKTLETLEKPKGKGSSSKPPTPPIVLTTNGRKFRDDGR